MEVVAKIINPVFFLLKIANMFVIFATKYDLVTEVKIPYGKYHYFWSEINKTWDGITISEWRHPSQVFCII